MAEKIVKTNSRENSNKNTKTNSSEDIKKSNNNSKNDTNNDKKVAINYLWRSIQSEKKSSQENDPDKNKNDSPSAGNDEALPSGVSNDAEQANNSNDVGNESYNQEANDLVRSNDSANKVVNEINNESNNKNDINSSLISTSAEINSKVTAQEEIVAVSNSDTVETNANTNVTGKEAAEIYEFLDDFGSENFGDKIKFSINDIKEMQSAEIDGAPAKFSSIDDWDFYLISNSVDADTGAGLIELPDGGVPATGSTGRANFEKELQISIVENMATQALYSPAESKEEIAANASARRQAANALDTEINRINAQAEKNESDEQILNNLQILRKSLGDVNGPAPDKGENFLNISIANNGTLSSVDYILAGAAKAGVISDPLYPTAEDQDVFADLTEVMSTVGFESLPDLAQYGDAIKYAEEYFSTYEHENSGEGSEFNPTTLMDRLSYENGKPPYHEIIEFLYDQQENYGSDGFFAFGDIKKIIGDGVEVPPGFEYIDKNTFAVMCSPGMDLINVRHFLPNGLLENKDSPEYNIFKTKLQVRISTNRANGALYVTNETPANKELRMQASDELNKAISSLTDQLEDAKAKDVFNNGVWQEWVVEHNKNAQVMSDIQENISQLQRLLGALGDVNGPAPDTGGNYLNIRGSLGPLSADDYMRAALAKDGLINNPAFLTFEDEKKLWEFKGVVQEAMRDDGMSVLGKFDLAFDYARNFLSARETQFKASLDSELNSELHTRMRYEMGDLPFADFYKFLNEQTSDYGDGSGIFSAGDIKDIVSGGDFPPGFDSLTDDVNFYLMANTIAENGDLAINARALLNSEGLPDANFEAQVWAIVASNRANLALDVTNDRPASFELRNLAANDIDIAIAKNESQVSDAKDGIRAVFDAIRAGSDNPAIDAALLQIMHSSNPEAGNFIMPDFINGLKSGVSASDVNKRNALDYIKNFLNDLLTPEINALIEDISNLHVAEKTIEQLENQKQALGNVQAPPPAHRLITSIYKRHSTNFHAHLITCFQAWFMLAYAMTRQIFPLRVRKNLMSSRNLLLQEILKTRNLKNMLRHSTTHKSFLQIMMMFSRGLNQAWHSHCAIDWAMRWG